VAGVVTPMVALTIPFPPSTNGYIRHSRGGHFPTAKAKAFRRDVAEIVSSEGVAAMPGRLQVTLRLFAPTKARRDIDNYAKPAIDALMHAGCFADDEQIDVLQIVRGPVQKGGAVRVVIAALPASAAEVDLL